MDVAKSNAYTKFSAYFQTACLLLMNHSDQGPSAIPHYHLCSNTTSMQMENIIKTPLSLLRVRSGKWIRDVTLPAPGKGDAS